MFLESFAVLTLKAFLTKIAATVLKGSALGYALKAYKIYSVYETISDAIGCIKSVNFCPCISQWGISVVSDYLGQGATDRLLEIGSDSFIVEQRASGLYIASKIVPTFRTTNIERSFFSREINRPQVPPPWHPSYPFPWHSMHHRNPRNQPFNPLNPNSPTNPMNPNNPMRRR
jgi:hypothetical protein